MQPMNHQMMGYDRAITMFSPDGRLLQVEYAKKTVKQGSTTIGIAVKAGVVLISDKRILNKLIIPDSVEKIFEVDEHIGATASGIVSDARVLVERAQVKAQQARITYDTPVDVLSIVKDLASLMQLTTQTGSYRPFGVSTIVGGVDTQGPSVYLVDPTGIFFQYKAVAVGEGDSEAEEVLQKEYKEDMSVDDTISLGLTALKTFLKEDFDIRRIDCAVISASDKKYRRLPSKEVERLVK
jgi:proteasome alpha subunit